MKTAHANHEMHAPVNVIETATYLLATGASAIVALTQSRFDPDIVAVLGAMLAAAVVVVDARKKDKSAEHTISVIIASAVSGGVGPGAFVWWKWPDLFPMISWHVWALMGFGVGLIGWKVTAWILGLSVGEIPGFVIKFLSLFSKKP